MSPGLTQILDRVGGSQRIMALLVGIGALGVIWGFSRWGMQPNYVPVAPGLSMERIGEATQRLDEAGIDYRLDRGGSLITVEERSAGRARVILASEGLSGDAARPGFELFDQPSWGMTDFTQRVNYRRALEGELERTIGRMRGVEGAQVHLTIQESSYLKRPDRPSEASVVLEQTPNSAADESVVEGIQFLVASSVEGLSPENVTVLDDRGRLLSSPDGNGGIGLSNRQLQAQQQVERYLQNKAEVLVQQIVGPDNASVRVSAALNFDQIDRTVQGVNPDEQALVSEDKAEITPGQADQGAGSLTTNTVFENTRSVETLSRGGARLERLTVAVVLGDKKTEAPDGSVTHQARTPAEIQQIEAVVRNAVGFSEERGDKISVVSVPMEEVAAPVPVETGPNLMDALLAYQRPIVAVIGLVIALLLATKVLKTLQIRHVIPAGARAEALSAGGNESELGSSPARASLPAPEPAVPAPQLSDPAMTARVVRAWMKES